MRMGKDETQEEPNAAGTIHDKSSKKKGRVGEDL
jgi:hypothetical protein